MSRPASEVIIDSPRYWRDRAEEVRVLAEGMEMRETRMILAHVADSYKRLAEWAECRERRERPSAEVIPTRVSLQRFDR